MASQTLEEIDFSKFPVEEKSDSLCENLRKTSFYGVPIIYPIEFPTFFSLDSFLEVCKSKQAKEKFKCVFTSSLSLYREILEKDGLNVENSCRFLQYQKSNNAKFRFCDSRLFWPLLAWSDDVLFVNSMFKYLFDIDLKHDFITFKNIEHKSVHTAKVLGISCKIDTDSTVNINEFTQNFRKNVGIENTNRIKLTQKPYNEIINEMSGNFNKPLFTYKSTGKSQVFYAFNVLLYALAYKEKFAFWLFLEEFFFREDYNIEKNKVFGEANESKGVDENLFEERVFNGYNLTFHSETGYFSFHSLAKALGIVDNHVVDRFKNPMYQTALREAESTIEFVPSKNVNYNADLALHRAYFTERRNKENAGIYLHPNCFNFALDILTRGPRGAKITTQVQKEAFLEADKLIDLRRLLTEKLNDDFGICEMDVGLEFKLKILFHLKTSFIHARFVGKQINETKASNVDRWLKSEDTYDFIKEMRGSDGRGGDEATEESENLDLFSIPKQIEKNKAYFQLSRVENKFKGYYFDPEFFGYFLIWLSKTVGYKYMRLLMLEIYKLNLEGKTFSKVMQKKVQSLETKIKDYEAKIKELNDKLLRYDALSGSIKIKRMKGGDYKTTAKTYNQVQTKFDTVIRNVENVKQMNQYIYNHIKAHPQSFIQARKELNRFDVYDEEKARDYILSIINKSVQTPVKKFSFNEAEYERRLSNFRKSNNSPRSKGFLFESIMSRKYKANLWQDKSEDFILNFGLPNEDCGIDLVDEENKICYQCKHVKSLPLTNALSRTLELFSKVKKIDTEYKLVLICRSDSVVSKNVKERYEDVIYEPPVSIDFF